MGVITLQGFSPNSKKNASSTTDEISRLSCSTNQYDSVVAISEDMQNMQLESYFNMEKSLQTVKITNYSVKSGIDAKLAPPRIQIISDPKSIDRSKIIYRLRIKTGRIFYTTIDPAFFNPDEDDMEKVDIKDWDFAFAVNLGKFPRVKCVL
jgi:hypothetical protein